MAPEPFRLTRRELLSSAALAAAPSVVWRRGARAPQYRIEIREVLLPRIVSLGETTQLGGRVAFLPSGDFHGAEAVLRYEFTSGDERMIHGELRLRVPPAVHVVDFHSVDYLWRPNRAGLQKVTLRILNADSRSGRPAPVSTWVTVLRPPVPPKNLSPPVISGLPLPGETLHVTTGTWT